MLEVSPTWTSRNYESFRQAAVGGTVFTLSFACLLPFAILSYTGSSRPRHRFTTLTAVNPPPFPIGASDWVASKFMRFSPDSQSLCIDRWLGWQRTAWRLNRPITAMVCGAVVRLLSIQHLAAKILIELPCETLYWSWQGMQNTAVLLWNGRSFVEVCASNSKIASCTLVIFVQRVLQDCCNIAIPELLSESPVLRSFRNQTELLRMFACVHHIPKVLQTIANENPSCDPMAANITYHRRVLQHLWNDPGILNASSRASLAARIDTLSRNLIVAESKAILHVQLLAQSAPDQAYNRLDHSTDYIQGRLDELANRGINQPSTEEALLQLIARLSPERPPETEKAFSRCFFPYLKRSRDILLAGKHFDAEEIASMYGPSYKAMLCLAIHHLLRESEVQDTTLIVKGPDEAPIPFQKMVNGSTELFDALVKARQLYTTQKGTEQLLLSLKNPEASMTLSPNDKKLFDAIILVKGLVDKRVMTNTALPWAEAFSS